jgi:hypothetical protein
LNARYDREEAAQFLSHATRAAAAEIPHPSPKATSPSEPGEPPGRATATTSEDRFAYRIGGSIGPAVDPRSRSILKKLDEAIPMRFSSDATLEDALKHVESRTKSAEFPRGLPIYLDPTGLHDVGVTTRSKISMDLEGVPLRRTLALLLKQLKLAYTILDGMIYVSSESWHQIAVPEPAPLSSPFLMLQLKLERGELNAGERRDLIDLLKDLNEVERLKKNRGGAKSKKVSGDGGE